MIVFIPVAEKNTEVLPPVVTALAAATAVVAFPDQRFVQSQTIVKRYIQNVGAQRVYVNLCVGGAGSTPAAPVASCDNLLNFHGYIEAGQTYDCSASLQQVSVYSPAGSTIATVISIRR